MDGSGDVVASSGRISEPYLVKIAPQVDGEAPHWPDHAAPAACAAGTTAPPPAPTSDGESTDCPPDFPGCKDTTKAATCSTDDDCSAGQSCSDGECSSGAHGEKPYKRNWFSVAFQADALLIPSASNACAGASGYTCFQSNRSYYSPDPVSNADDQVNGGVTLATQRILVGYDRAFAGHVTAGVRLGYAIGGGPQRPTASSFLPVHAEGRRSRTRFGRDALARKGLRFYVVGAGGMAQVDASVPVDVFTQPSDYPNNQTNLRAWKKTGLAFAALGPGGMYAITPSTGILLEAKIMEMLPTTATGFNLQLAYVVGL